MAGLLIWPPPPALSTIEVSRPNYDGRGNRNPQTYSLQAVVSLQPAMSRPRLGEGQENRFLQDAAIYIPRGTAGPDNPFNGAPTLGLQAGDEITYNSEKFTIAGDARGDQEHPFTGSDFGWMGFRMQGAG